MHKKTIRQIDVAGKTVLLRVDYNVPLDIDGSIEDIYRIQGSLPTIRYLQKKKCKIVLISHLGRPEGKVNLRYSLRPVAKKVSQLLGHEVGFLADCVGPLVQASVKNLNPGGIVLLENLRFHSGEEADSHEFAKQLAALGDVFVQDAFGNVHRKHASMDAITRYLPAVAGLLLEKELQIISGALEHPKRPLLAIIGGAKVSDKIEVIDNFVKRADHLVIAGAMANTFFLDKHFKHPIGKSLHEDNMQGEVAHILSVIKAKYHTKSKSDEERIHSFLVLPDIDVVVTKKITEDALGTTVPIDSVKPDDIIADFGPQSLKQILKLVDRAGTIIWNGPLGITEVKAFTKSSITLARAMAQTKAQTILAGGDTAAFVDEAHLLHRFNHVSTGGGAALDLMAGKKLPGVEALENI